MQTNDHRLVFVGGLHRSGTTPLTRMLAEHPQVSGFAGTTATEDEGQHLQDVYPSARSYGGPGLFALSLRSHLDETSPLVSEENARRLWEQWSLHWDLSKPVLVEKSPPNIVMTRFLQALYPEAAFVMVVRHPLIVTLGTRKWTLGRPMRRLMENWFAAHDRLRADAPHVKRLHVLKYEDLVADPDRTLTDLATFLGLDGPIPAASLQRSRSSGYERAWTELRQSRLPWRRRSAESLVRRYEGRAQEYGYSLLDLDRRDPFPA